ncbi:MAG: T9SS type A sorting domain-containing protein [Candidatus Marinimicrobia bacterium]|nr:T9SS type A sorting domain-containing protein [Candidatus Neomarinimicrobiota bacterium]
MKKIVSFGLMLVLAMHAFGQIPSLIEVTAENFGPYFQSDFKNVLLYVPQGVDTIVLGSSGFNYSTEDTVPMVIEHPVVIMAAAGLEEKPVFTHPNTGFVSGEPNAAMEIFRICNDVEFHGVRFVGNHESSNGCKYGCRYGDWIEPGTERPVKAKTGARIVFDNCEMEGFHSLGDDSQQGNFLYYLRPDDTSLDHLRNTRVFFNNCIIKDIGDEAIRIAENEKYGGTNGVNALDTLVVTNCTFEDIDAECLRFYADKDTGQEGSTYVDGYVLVDHVTVVNCSPRFIYAKNYRAVTVRNILIAHGRSPSASRGDRGDYNIQIQLSGSTVSHIDTFDVYFTMDYDPRIGATKGGYVDESTIYGYDPMFEDYENGNYTLAEGSPMYYLSSDATAIGDLRWATHMPVAIEDEEIVTGQFELMQNYPNPFNPATVIKFALPKTAVTTLTIYNMLGQEVVNLVNNQNYTAGQYEVNFDASHLTSGVYFYRLESGDFNATKKMIFLK